MDGRPNPNNALSYMNFVTDFSGKNLALMNNAANPEMESIADQSDVRHGEAQKKDIKTGKMFALPAPEAPKK